jgi:hypothetical protein
LAVLLALAFAGGDHLALAMPASTIGGASVGSEAPAFTAALEAHAPRIGGVIRAAMADVAGDEAALGPSRGLFDLTTPLLERIDGVMAPWLPDIARLSVWGLIAAVVSMGLYRLTSNQARLAANRAQVVAVQKRLSDFDGPFAEAWPLLRRNLALAAHRVWLTLGPAVLASVPVIFILAFLANAFDTHFAAVGEGVPVRATAVAGRVLPPLRWEGADAVRAEGEGTWTIAWPAAAAPLRLIESEGGAVLTLPTAAPVGAVHQRRWWNLLLGNPAGYLPADGAVDVVELDLPRAEFLPFGPSWLRGWLAWFFAVVLVASLALKWLWRLH